MKSRAVMCLALAFAACAFGASETKPVPAKPRLAPVAAAAPSAIPKVETAARTAVAAHFRNGVFIAGSNGVTVAGVAVKINETAPITGWTGRYRTKGTAELTLSGKGLSPADRKQTRSFEVISQVDAGGNATALEVSNN